MGERVRSAEAQAADARGQLAGLSEQLREALAELGRERERSASASLTNASSEKSAAIAATRDQLEAMEQLRATRDELQLAKCA